MLDRHTERNVKRSCVQLDDLACFLTAAKNIAAFFGLRTRYLAVCQNITERPYGLLVNAVCLKHRYESVRNQTADVLVGTDVDIISPVSHTP